MVRYWQDKSKIKWHLEGDRKQNQNQEQNQNDFLFEA
jgi:hypothetical protein